MKQATIRQVKKGEFFRLSSSDTAPVWVKGYYLPSEKKYEAYKYEDCNHESFFNGNKKVFIGFTF